MNKDEFEERTKNLHPLIGNRSFEVPMLIKPIQPNDFDKKYAEIQQKLTDFAMNNLSVPANIINPPENPNDPTS